MKFGLYIIQILTNGCNRSNSPQNGPFLFLACAPLVCAYLWPIIALALTDFRNLPPSVIFLSNGKQKGKIFAESSQSLPMTCVVLVWPLPPQPKNTQCASAWAHPNLTEVWLATQPKSIHPRYPLRFYPDSQLGTQPSKKTAPLLIGTSLPTFGNNDSTWKQMWQQGVAPT